LLIVYNYRHVQPSLLQLYCGSTVNYGGEGAEIAKLDIARPDNVAPDSRGGHCET